jgi:hypothetical protein
VRNANLLVGKKRSETPNDAIQQIGAAGYRPRLGLLYTPAGHNNPGVDL